jgi:hypothetical protein
MSRRPLSASILDAKPGPRSNRPEYLWRAVDKNGPLPKNRPELGPCWIWKNRTCNGYPVFTCARTTYRAHRATYELTRGRIPQRLVTDHLCRTPLCVNPKHLEAVTDKVNVLRGCSPCAVNSRKTRCKRGHRLVGGNINLWKGQRTCRTCKKNRDRQRWIEGKYK